MPPRRSRPDEEEDASLRGLGLAVTQLREDLGLSREAAVKKAGLTVPTITGIEKAKTREPRWGTLRRLAKALEVPVNDLVELGIQLAPGPAGDRLRHRDREARHIDIEALDSNRSPKCRNLLLR